MIRRATPNGHQHTAGSRLGRRRDDLNDDLRDTCALAATAQGRDCGVGADCTQVFGTVATRPRVCAQIRSWVTALDGVSQGLLARVVDYMETQPVWGVRESQTAVGVGEGE